MISNFSLKQRLHLLLELLYGECDAGMRQEIKCSMLLSLRVQICVLSSVEFLCLAWRNDAVWFLYVYVYVYVYVYIIYIYIAVNLHCCFPLTSPFVRASRGNKVLTRVHLQNSPFSLLAITLEGRQIPKMCLIVG